MGCCGVTYEEEVEEEIIKYLKTINKPDSTKAKLLKEIKDDLSKRASTVNRYYYPYREEDVEKTVTFYKNYISIKLKGFVELYDVKKKEDKDEKKDNEKKEEEKKEEEKKEEEKKEDDKKEEDKKEKEKEKKKKKREKRENESQIDYGEEEDEKSDSENKLNDKKDEKESKNSNKKE